MFPAHYIPDLKRKGGRVLCVTGRKQSQWSSVCYISILVSPLQVIPFSGSHSPSSLHPKYSGVFYPFSNFYPLPVSVIPEVDRLRLSQSSLPSSQLHPLVMEIWHWEMRPSVVTVTFKSIYLRGKLVKASLSLYLVRPEDYKCTGVKATR